MQQAISYRDRAGFIRVENGRVRRFVNFVYADDYDHLLASGLYEILVQKGLLISHTEVEPDSTYYKIIEPEQIAFISQPGEWTATQWKEVLLCFLRINQLSISQGMILKDATPFNFTFYKGNCILFDTLSFTRYRDGDAWIGYRQFCTSMLGPAALMLKEDIAWGRMFHSYADGWPLSFLSHSLSWKTRFSPLLLLHIHWHARTRHSNTEKVNGKGLTTDKLKLLWSMMASSIRKWEPRRAVQLWPEYYTNSILSNAYLDTKKTFVHKWLAEIRPSRVIDLGANTGMFSFLASAYAGSVLAIESDHDCVEELRKQLRTQKYTDIETVWADITRPTPATGWNNSERAALLTRLRGDMLLALAVIHHICITANVSLELVAGLFADITNAYLIVEFVPRSDPKVKEMLMNREDVFADYTEDRFIESFQRYFSIIDSGTCTPSDRKLFLCRKK